jgi:hypothetical protein
MAVRFSPTTLLSSRKRNRLRESPGVSNSMTIRSTDILSVPPHTYYLAPPYGGEADPAVEQFLRAGSNSTCMQNGSKQSGVSRAASA